MKTEAEYDIETSVMIHQMTWHYTLGNVILQIIRRDNPKHSKQVFFI
jgi:hypothetical protein